MSEPRTGGEMRYAAPPSVWPAYLRILLSRKPALAAAATMEATAARMRVQTRPAALAAYRAVCGGADDGNLPLAYPHVLAFPLYLAMLTAPQFPVRLPGLVHVANTITRSRPIGAGETLDLLCTLPGLRVTERGQEFELLTEATSKGETVWRETCVFLARGPAAPGAASTPFTPLHPPPQASASHWEAPADTGRRYARVSGDRNPIHLYAAGARLFGYPRAIAHGMWSVARVAAGIERRTGQPLAHLEAAFKLPVYLPAQLRLFTWPATGAHACVLTGVDENKPHLSGRYTLA